MVSNGGGYWFNMSIPVRSRIKMLSRQHIDGLILISQGGVRRSFDHFRFSRFFAFFIDS